MRPPQPPSETQLFEARRGGRRHSVCLRCHMVEPGHRAVDELARCRGVFEDRGDGLLDLRGRGLFAGIAGGEKKRRERECIFIHVFHNFYGFGRDSARVFPGLAGARAPAPPLPGRFLRAGGGPSATAPVARRTIRRRVARGRVGVSVCLPVPNGTKILFFRHMAAGIRAKSRGFEKKINFVKNIREVWRSK